MASDILEMTAEIVISHASITEMSSADLVKEISQVYTTLQCLENGEQPAAIASPVQEPKKRGRKPRAVIEAEKEPVAIPEPPAEKVEEKPAIPTGPAMTIEEAFKPDQVGCMICGKTGMKTLKRHLGTAHNLKPGQYRKQFNIPKDQPLAATEYIAARRQVAIDRGLADKLADARARSGKQIKPQTEKRTGVRNLNVIARCDHNVGHGGR